MVNVPLNVNALMTIYTSELSVFSLDANSLLNEKRKHTVFLLWTMIIDKLYKWLRIRFHGPQTAIEEK